jgi:hypothetical protein
MNYEKSKPLPNLSNPIVGADEQVSDWIFQGLLIIL